VVTQAAGTTAAPAITEVFTQAVTEAPAVTAAPTQAVTEAPAATEALTQPATEAVVATEAPQETPAVALFPVPKPTLVMIDPRRSTTSTGFAASQTVAFVFPDGTAAIKAGSVVEPQPVEGGLTVIGMVQVADGAELIAPGIYAVEIDLTSKEADVAVQLVSNETTREMKFHRTQLVRNPERAEDPSFPAISPIIASDGVCFVVGIGKPNVMEIPGAVNRYCSGESVDTNEPILSVKANFSEAYRKLTASLNDSLAALKNQPLPGVTPISIDVLPDLTISEIEGHSNIERCNADPEACTADIIGAPSASFWNDYDTAQKDAAGARNFVVTEGFVRVAQRLEIPNQPTVEPGIYWIRDWFDPNGKFLGTALVGWTDQKQPVNGLTIAATPTYFLEASGQRQVVSWISGWHCFHWCKWQSRCP
jgi:hypothetical protein